MAAAAFGFAFSEGLGADAIRAAGALLDRGRVPGQVVVDDVTAVSVEVDALLADRCADEDIGQEGGVETRKDSVALLLPGGLVAAPVLWLSQRLLRRAPAA